MRVLVTGGTGFLGRAVVKVLAGHGHEVVVLSRPTSPVEDWPVTYADLRDRDRLAEAIAPFGLDAVCHLAALTSVRDSFADPVGYYDVNVGGTINLLQALAGRPVRFVYASTSAIYGSARPGQLSEDMEPQAENPYAASKLAAEQLIGYQAATGAIGSVVLRCFNIAGAVDGYGDPDTTRIIPNTLRAAAGTIPHVTLNGDGSARREFTHVLDVAEAVRLALDAAEPGQHQVLNVGTGDGVTMAEVIAAAEMVTGRSIPVVHRPPAREAHTLIADGRRIREVLRWQPRRSTIEAILTDAWTATSPTQPAHPKET